MSRDFTPALRKNLDADYYGVSVIQTAIRKVRLGWCLGEASDESPCGTCSALDDLCAELHIDPEESR